MRTDQMGSGPTMADGQIAAIVSMLAAVMSANDPENWKRGLRAAISRSQREQATGTSEDIFEYWRGYEHAHRLALKQLEKVLAVTGGAVR